MLCIVAAIHILVLVCFPLVICKYVASHDDSFCKVLCQRTRGFCKFWGKSIKGYYYPIAVVNDEEVKFVEDIDYKARAESNKEFLDQEKIVDFIEQRKKKFSDFNETICPGCD